MKIGTKSILFGAHCFFIHPWFVALAWYKLYGFPWDPRLWFAFFLHDLGYWGLPNMDGEEGELHPVWGAKVMHRLFDKRRLDLHTGYNNLDTDWTWYDFTLYHSRFFAKKNNAHFSKLCVADKYSFCITPSWLYLPMVNWSGEIYEYMKLAEQREEDANTQGKYTTIKIDTDTQYKWWSGVSEYLKGWVEEHKDMRQDTWTPDSKQALDKTGTWK